MVRKLTVLMVFSLLALFAASIVCADQAGISNGALPLVVKANDKLLMNPDISKNQNMFERWMMDLPKIIAKKDIMSSFHSSRAVNSGA